jgi:hypothetical protein
MGSGFSSRSPVRWLAALAAIGAMWWVAFEQQERIPILTYLNLGIHEGGHMITYSASQMTTSLAGSIAQVLVPLLFVAYFLISRKDWVAAGVCLAWAATSAMEVSLYVADARTQKLDLLGENQHDWAYILGPDGYNAMDKAASLAHTISDAASVAAVTAALMCLAAPLRGRRPRQSEPVASTSRATATSRP